MELIGKLKKDVENSKDIKEARSIMEKAGMRLTNEELQQISGGTGDWGSEVFYVYSSKGTYVYDNIFDAFRIVDCHAGARNDVADIMHRS